MQGPRKDERARWIGRALAALLSAAILSLLPAPARADRTDDETPTRVKKPKKDAHHADANGKKGKKSAHRTDTDARRAPTHARPCAGTATSLDRGGLEGQRMTLVDCHGKPLEPARVALSVLARPWGAQKPAHVDLPSHHPAHGKTHAPVRAGARDAADLAPGIRLVDEGLLSRLGAVSRHFPDRPVSLVSGYRPQSRGSLHQSARALDMRVAGVSNEELVAFCKTLPDTGCGYYPHSSFVHLDVRPKGTGTVSWIDTSGPGESPHYVKQWPPPAEAADVAVLPPDTDPHDAAHGVADPWAPDPADEHASFPAVRAAPPAPTVAPTGAGLAVSPAPATPAAPPAPMGVPSVPPPSSSGPALPSAAAPAVNHP